MSLFEGLFGSTRKIKDAAAVSEAGIKDGYNAAKPIYDTGFNNAEKSQAWGNNAAYDYITGGFDAAKQGTRGAYGNANAALGNAYGNAQNALSTGISNAANVAQTGYGNAAQTALGGASQATGYLNPYMNNGAGGSNLYATALGINGRGEQGQLVQQFAANDPFRQHNEDYATRNLMAAYNARGLGGSGKEMLAAARASMDRGAQDWQQYLSNLAGMQGVGLQAAGQAGGYTMQGAGQAAGLQGQGAGTAAGLYGTGAVNSANLYGQQGESAAGLATGEGRALADLDVARGTQAGNLRNEQGRTQSQLDLLRAQTMGGLEAGLPMAIAQNTAGRMGAEGQAQAAGANNLLKIAGTVASLGAMPLGVAGAGAVAPTLGGSLYNWFAGK